MNGEVWSGLARDLVAALMPVSALVEGRQAAALGAALEAAGVAPCGAEEPADLAVLLASPSDAAVEAKLLGLASRADRLLFLPWDETLPKLEAVTGWFERLAELGFQPVTDFDAGALAPGAFLLDRSATADEEALAVFAARVASPDAVAPEASKAAEPEAVRGPDPALEDARAECARLREQVAALERARDAAREEADRAQAVAAALAPLRDWIDIVARRGPKRAWWRRASESERRAEAIRNAPDFDPVGYLLSHPEAARTGADPAAHMASPRLPT